MKAAEVMQVFMELAGQDEELAAVVPMLQVQASAAEGQEVAIVELMDHALVVYAAARQVNITELPELTK